MKNNILSIIKKITIVSLIIMLFTMNTAQAFSFNFNKKKESNTSANTSIIQRIITKFTPKKYTLEDLKTDLEKLQTEQKVDISKVESLIKKLPKGENKDILNSMKTLLKKEDINKIIEELLKVVKELIGKISSGSGSTTDKSGLPVKATSITMEAKKAVEFAGKDYSAKLHAIVYKHVDENGKEDSDKWAFLIHPYMLKSETIVKALGAMYYEKGYNIIAPDLRGFGKSEGELALGVLEALDVHDWLTLLNEKYDTSKVIVHGVSLGAATTNFLSGIDQFIKNGPIEMSEIKPITELNVCALVEDCGYTNMTELSKQDAFIDFDIGIPEKYLDYYNEGQNSLKYCELPYMIIHGTKDTTIKVKNADIVAETVKGPVEKWIIKGGMHAGIIMGSNKEEYKTKVHEFIDKYVD